MKEKSAAASAAATKRHIRSSRIPSNSSKDRTIGATVANTTSPGLPKSEGYGGN
jgi:hypothetical protein